MLKLYQSQVLPQASQALGVALPQDTMAKDVSSSESEEEEEDTDGHGQSFAEDSDEISPLMIFHSF